MSKQNSLPNVDHVVRLPQSGIGGTVRAIRSVDRDTGALPSHGARGLSQCASYAAAPVEKPDSSPIGWWLAALAFFMDGCAAYGASLYPGAEFPITSAPAPAKAGEPRPVLVLQPAAAEHGNPDRLENNVVTGLDCAVLANPRLQRHWSWLNSISGTVATIWRHWRRERDIQRMVSALAEYDDRTLRDLGICGRSDIERVVRHSRDC
ncbi:DUF1127 domain-containing protein [Bradyrhizobium elkanii]|uniref:DUF1127 domain-containing protein n=1 Tax=Bradyrhizobium elkanii TaxID=29448 RepID=UPI001BADFCFB|nr:DUF1127 domain-containing protein [Bradyrhizobium elkanii]MBR1159666.1 DUF1127 domain-containing protein [Bradyrhizobium elkanii]